MKIEFNRQEITADLYQCIPVGYPAKRISDGLFTLTSNWKKGKLMKFVIDDYDVTGKVNITQVEGRLNRVLMRSGRFKNHYSGKRVFYCTVEEGEIVKVIHQEASMILDREKNYKKQFERFNHKGGMK